MTLKLLPYEPTGAIVAAPTCSLPESIGGQRNWDYRYTWIRDAAFTIYGILRVGFTEEASRFADWLSARWHEAGLDGSGPLQLMYGIDGRSELTEETLGHLEGYRGSSPVRIGNGAYTQLQLDIYGELMDAVYLHNKYVAPIGYESWRRLRRLIDWLCDHWQFPDDGIWEVRGGSHHFVYLKFMSWVALDRSLRLADKRSFPADRARWLKVRDEIYEEVMSQGWNEDRKAFVQSYGSSALDASVLLMPLTFFMAPNDPRMLSTVDAVRRSVAAGGLAADGLVYRYDPNLALDDLGIGEGTFNMCSFWLVEALTRAGLTVLTPALQAQDTARPDMRQQPSGLFDFNQAWSDGKAEGKGRVLFSYPPMRVEDIGRIMPMGMMAALRLNHYPSAHRFAGNVKLLHEWFLKHRFVLCRTQPHDQKLFPHAYAHISIQQKADSAEHFLFYESLSPRD